MPVETLVIVPTSRGARLRRECFPRLADTRERAVEDRFAGLEVPCSLAALLRTQVFPASGSALASGSVLLLQKFVDALFQRREIIRDAPRHFLSIRGEFDAADQIRRGLEANVDFSRKGFIERVLYRRALLRRQVKRAAHERRARRRLEGLGEALPSPSPSISRKRRVNTAPMRSSRLVVARSASALRAMANTSCARDG